MNLKATRTPVKREQTVLHSWKLYLVGQVLAEGHHQHPGLAVPSLYFSSAGAEEDWKGRNFWFFDSAAVSLTLPGSGCRVWLRHGAKPLSYRPPIFFLGSQCASSVMRDMNRKIPPDMQGPKSWGHVHPCHHARGCQASAPFCFLDLQWVFSNSFFQNKNYYQGFSFLYFASLGHFCLLLIPMFISAPKHLGTGSVSGEFWTGRMWHCLLRLHLRPQMVGKIQPKHPICCEVPLWSLL